MCDNKYDNDVMNGGWVHLVLDLVFFRMCVCRLVRVGGGRDGRKGKVF